MPEQLAALPPTAAMPPSGDPGAAGRRFGPSTSFRDYSFESMVAESKPMASLESTARPAGETAPDGAAEPVGGIEGFLFGEDGFQFDDLIDIVNPLHHIPLLSILYREWTGDQIAAAPRVLGGALFGGYIGAAASVVDAVIEAETGDDIGQHALAFLFGDEEGAPAGGAPDTAIANAAPPPPPAGAVQVAGRPWLDGSPAKGDVLVAAMLAANSPPAAGSVVGAQLPPPGAVDVSGRPWLDGAPEGKETTLAAFSRNGMSAGHASTANLPANGLPPGAVNVVGRPWLTGAGAQAPAPVAATHRPAPNGPGLFRAGERSVTPVVPALAGAPREAVRPQTAALQPLAAVGSIPVLLAADAKESAAASTPDQAGFSQRMKDGLAKYGTLMRERNGAEAGIDILR